MGVPHTESVECRSADDAPMIYAVDGRQYVAAPIGQALFVFGIDGELGCVNSKSALWLQTQKRAAFQHW